MSPAVRNSGLLVLVAVAAIVTLALAEAGPFRRGGAESPSSPSWLTEPDQEQLADAVATADAHYGWAAGCLWPPGLEADHYDAVAQLGFERDDAWVLISAQQLESGTFMLLFRHPGPRVLDRNFDERIGDRFFCYVPEEIAPNVPSA